MYKRDLITRLEYRFSRFAIQNFMTVIIGVMAFVYVLDFVFVARVGRTLSSLLYFDRALIMSGELWRIFTFILIPPDRSPIFIIFALYLYWLYGSALEEQWGAFRFNLFYLCGIVGTVIAGFIVGSSTNSFLNMSIFFAFALLYPDFELRIMLLIPIKVKYIAFAGLILYVYAFIFYPLSYKAAIIAAFINVILFFYKDFISTVKRLKQNHDMKKRFKK